MGSLASPAKGRAFTACLLFFSSQCYYIRNKMWVGSVDSSSSPFLSVPPVNHGSVVKQKKSKGWLVGYILPFSVTPMHRTERRQALAVQADHHCWKYPSMDPHSYNTYIIWMKNPHPSIEPELPHLLALNLWRKSKAINLPTSGTSLASFWLFVSFSWFGWHQSLPLKLSI